MDILNEDDLFNLIDIEMQLSGFTKREYMRFQDYGFRMAESKLHRGDDYENMKKCYQIVFMDAYPSDSKSFIRTFQKRDSDNVLLKHNLITLTFVHLPMINDIVKEKGIENLTSFEKLCYVFENGPDDAILSVKERMVEAIMQKYEEMRNNAPIWSWASAVERGEQAYYNVIQDKYEEGMEKGIEKGMGEGKIVTLNELIHLKYQTDAKSWLTTLSEIQLNKIAKQLLICNTFEELKNSIDIKQVNKVM